MTILKAENGNVELLDDNGNSFEVLPPQARLQKDSHRNIIKIIYAQNNIVSIPFSSVAFTQIAPAAAVAFTGTLQELFDELKANFFFDLVGGGEVTIMDGYPASSYQGFVNAHSAANGNFVMVPNRIEGIVVDIKYPCTLESSRIRITSAAAGAAVAGIYKYDRLNDIWNLYAQIDVSSPFNLGIVSTQEMPYPSQVVFEPGVYCSVIHGNSAATIYSFARGAASTYFGFSATIGTTSERGYVRLTEPYTGTLPPTAGFAVGYRPGGLYPFILHKVIS